MDKDVDKEQIQAYTIKILQVLDGLPLVYGLIILDTAKQIIQQEIEAIQPKEIE